MLVRTNVIITTFVKTVADAKCAVFYVDFYERCSDYIEIGMTVPMTACAMAQVPSTSSEYHSARGYGTSTRYTCTRSSTAAYLSSTYVRCSWGARLQRTYVLDRYAAVLETSG